MHLKVISMVRNEEKHLDDALKHLSALFDEVVVIDHVSDDKTPQKLAAWSKKHPKIQRYTFKNPTYYQSELMTYFAREDIAEKGSDWLFFIDFDEFLPFKSRAEFEQALIQFAAEPIIQMPWFNLIPKRAVDKGHLGKDYLVSPDASPYFKVAIQPKLLADQPHLIIDQGNHWVLPTWTAKPLPAAHAFGLFHIPIDSEKQFLKKTAQGCAAYEAHGRNSDGKMGEHWFFMAETLKDQKNPRDVLNGFVAHYGETDKLRDLAQDDALAMTQDDLMEAGFRNVTLDVAHLDESIRAVRSSDIGEVCEIKLFPQGKIELSPPKEEKSAPDLPLYNDPESARFAPLDVKNPLLKGVKAPKDLLSFFSHSYRTIETMTPTAWGGHIPFMYALMACLRPRRFVELGSHCGASFFAACQKIQELDLPSQAVAIDLWEGDPQAGFYGEDVYQNFEYLRMSRYGAVSRSIRSLFADAVDQFEDHSIDLLHIDGLHTYAAVKEDYELWRPKLTENGVIIFHDTGEYLSDFGVWDFFASIRSEATASFEFKHTHGLGVLAFGKAAQNPMIKVLNMMNDRQVDVERHFAFLGEVTEQHALHQFVRMREAQNDKQEIAPINSEPAEKRYRSEMQTIDVPAKVLLKEVFMRGRMRIQGEVRRLVRRH